MALLVVLLGFVALELLVLVLVLRRLIKHMEPLPPFQLIEYNGPPPPPASQNINVPVRT